MLVTIKSNINILLKNKEISIIKNIYHDIIDYAKEHHITQGEIIAYQEEKNGIRGSFYNKIFCYLFLLHHTDQRVNEYRKKHAEYSEIKMTPNSYSNDYIAFSCNKLVRDKVPERISKQGGVLYYKLLSHGDFQKALEEKLIEEYEELYHAQNKNEIIEESADLLEILKHIELLYQEKKSKI
jgi:predicted house-cleaning noncanonical NTP pyrophosphatase (MazG superfamily)